MHSPKGAGSERRAASESKSESDLNIDLDSISHTSGLESIEAASAKMTSTSLPIKIKERVRQSRPFLADNECDSSASPFFSSSSSQSNRIVHTLHDDHLQRLEEEPEQEEVDSFAMPSLQSLAELVSAGSGEDDARGRHPRRPPLLSLGQLVQCTLIPSACVHSSSSFSEAVCCLLLRRRSILFLSLAFLLAVLASILGRKAVMLGNNNRVGTLSSPLTY